jgi:hypothetical protein
LKHLGRNRDIVAAIARVAAVLCLVLCLGRRIAAVILPLQAGAACAMVGPISNSARAEWILEFPANAQ